MNCRSGQIPRACLNLLRKTVPVATMSRRSGVNAKGGFGVWYHDVAFEMSKIDDILERHGTA